MIVAQKRASYSVDRGNPCLVGMNACLRLIPSGVISRLSPLLAGAADLGCGVDPDERGAANPGLSIDRFGTAHCPVGDL